MGIIERKSREREHRRQLITDIAKELILEDGVEAVTMLGIAKKAGLSKAALYLSFESKDEILERIFDEAVSRFIDYVEAHISRESTGLEALKTFWMSYIEVFGSSSEILVLFGIKNYIAPGFPAFVEPSPRDEGKSHFRLFRLLADTVARGMADGTLESSKDAVQVSRTILTICGGIIDNVARLPLERRNGSLIIGEMKSAFEIVMWGLASDRRNPSSLVLPVTR